MVMNRITASRMKREQANPSPFSVRNAYDQLCGASISAKRLVEFLVAASQGQHSLYLQYAAEMERRDARYFGLLQIRKLACCQLPRKVIAPDDSKEEVAIADWLTGFVKGPEFSRSLFTMQDALGKGISFTEIMMDTIAGRWVPVALKWRNPKWFILDENTGEWLVQSNTKPEGEPLWAHKFIIHQPGLSAGLPLAGGLARVCSAMSLFKSFGWRDWMAFSEVFGQPLRVGKHPQNADPSMVETLRDAVEKIGSDAAVVIPENLVIEFERSANSGMAGSDQFFLNLISMLNEEMSGAILGSNMTTERGGSNAKTVTLNEVRTDIRNGDVDGLCAALNRDLIKPLVDFNFGPRDYDYEYPRLVLDTVDNVDLESMSKALIPFIDRGVAVESSVMRDMFGLPDPEGSKDVVQPLAKMEPPPAPPAKKAP